MPQTIGAYQTAPFTVPVNEAAGNADEVRGNDNSLRASLNSHDGDAGIHFQGSTLAARPVAGTVGRKWLTTDDRKIWYDNGSAWQECGVPSDSPVFTGIVTVASEILAAGASGLKFNASHASGAIAFHSGNALRWTLSAAGHLIPAVDGAYDLGNTSFSPRTYYSQGSTLVMQAGNVNLLRTRRTGWTTDPTGTLTRTTFDSTTVTLANLAARVAALIVDLRDHGLIGP